MILETDQDVPQEIIEEAQVLEGIIKVTYLQAVVCAEMALAGIDSSIPVEQVIDAMREVGDNMPSMYKETACGGCANTPRELEVARMLES